MPQSVPLSSFNAVRYRGIDGLELPRLSKANLVTGANGAGKTALIEAIWIFAGRYTPGILWNANVQRSDDPPLDPIAHLTDSDMVLRGVECGKTREVKFSFHRLNGATENGYTSGTIAKDPKQLPPVIGRIRTVLDGTAVEEKPQGMSLTPSGLVLHDQLKPPTLPLRCTIDSPKLRLETTSAYQKRYSDLVRKGRKRALLEAMGLLTGEIQDTEFLTDESGRKSLSVTIAGGPPRPLKDLGSGATNLFRLLLGIEASENGVLLSDEIENGIHHSLFEGIWMEVRTWMDRWNVQLIGTTHSAELIDAAIDVFADAPDLLSIHHLFRNETDEKTGVATYTGSALLGARGLNLEVR